MPNALSFLSFVITAFGFKDGVRRWGDGLASERHAECCDLKNGMRDKETMRHGGIFMAGREM